MRRTKRPSGMNWECDVRRLRQTVLLTIALLALSGTAQAEGMRPAAHTPAVPSMQGQALGAVRRTVLVEFFCTQGCQWAASAAEALDRVADEYGTDRVLALEYNLDLNGQLFEERFYRYVPPGTHVPFAFFDGGRLGVYGSNNDVAESYGWYRDAVEQELAAPSPLRVRVAGRLDGRRMLFEVRVTNCSSQDFDPAEVYCAIYERAQRGRSHRFLWHLSPALAVDSLAPGESQTFTYSSCSLPAEVNLNLVEGLAFVQRSGGNNEVFQAAHAEAPGFALSPPALAVMLTRGGSPPGPQSITVDGLGLPFHWSLDVPSSAAWLHVSPTSGARGEQFQVTIDSAGLAYGSYQTSITVSADAPVTPAQLTLPITLYVVPHVESTFLPLISSY